MKATEQYSPVSGKAAKHAAGTKRGKTCSWCRARENMQLVPSVGKHAAGAERGKTCSWCRARDIAIGFGGRGRSQPHQRFVGCLFCLYARLDEE